MSQQTTRRALLSARVLRRDEDAIRPPGWVEARFDDLCSQCGDCVSVCPEGILKAGADGFPKVDFDLAACTFCGRCAESCQTGALSAEHVSLWPWRALIHDHCLSMTGISCRSCQDSCDQSAIRFKLQLGGRAQPEIDLDRCTGCGACASVCPVGAVSFEQQSAVAPEVLS
ncbi:MULTISPECIES: ferredoxin-type protein NapF [unclassified Ruegeria]|uniref:ferredoxin-type protein NapF n=1 Tax=unclassified Ruegeria TaxID=2625375 RepID=UPI0014887C8E|nr:MULTISPECIES: ferredoxin-type protein NapF [unclassified Ruegeria]